MRKSSARTPDDAAICRAIERHLGMWWTDELKKKISDEVGAVGLKRIEEITSFASAQDEWQQGELSSAADKVAVRLHEKFPFLSGAASLRVMNHATYGWR